MYAFFRLPCLMWAPKLCGVPCINFCDIRRIKQCISPKAQRDERREWMKGDQSVHQQAAFCLFVFKGCCVRLCVYHQHGWHTAINTAILWLGSPAIWLQLPICQDDMIKHYDREVVSCQRVISHKYRLFLWNHNINTAHVLYVGLFCHVI